MRVSILLTHTVEYVIKYPMTPGSLYPSKTSHKKPPMTPSPKGPHTLPKPHKNNPI